MLRPISVALVLFAFAGSAFADCGGAHNAKETLSPEQQANASQAPAVAKTALPAAKTPAKAAKKPGTDKASADKVAANKPTE